MQFTLLSVYTFVAKVPFNDFKSSYITLHQQVWGRLLIFGVMGG